jgi:hypothetical protein
MPKQKLNGTPGKKPRAPSVKRRCGTSFSTMVEILNGRKLRQADETETIHRTKPVSVRRGRS